METSRWKVELVAGFAYRKKPRASMTSNRFYTRFKLANGKTFLFFWTAKHRHLIGERKKKLQFSWCSSSIDKNTMVRKIISDISLITQAKRNCYVSDCWVDCVMFFLEWKILRDASLLTADIYYATWFMIQCTMSKVCFMCQLQYLPV